MSADTTTVAAPSATVAGFDLARVRTPLLVAVGARAVLAAVAIPLAAFLYRQHFVVLVLLRPTKDVLLAAGFLLRRGKVNPFEIVAAAVPLMVFGVWLFFLIGRAYHEQILTGEGLPRWSRRLLPHEKIQSVSEVLEKRGAPLIVLGRLAAFPSTLVAAAAGASDMRARTFVLADALGAALSIAEVVVAGYAFGEAYKKAGPWVTGAGVVVLIGLLLLVGRHLKKA
ncbi:MAG TPA: VTT domain-containing protein [Acidimicrobiales bacterium]|nr:VTT domain-containing protein [Acidimicrobiales bacterium]